MGAGDRQPAAGGLIHGAPAEDGSRRALADVAEALACPHCAAALTLEATSLVCPRGHRFDLARQGYVNLLRPGRPTGTADTAAMVAARFRVHEAGHLEPLTRALVEEAAALRAVPPGGLVLDLGAGPGRHTAAVVDGLAGSRGLAVDLSKPALRRAARAHPRVAAVVADAWDALPVRDAAVDLALAVFAPRTAGELARVLRPGGALVLATPAPGHLAELVDRFDLLAVDPGKVDRVTRAFAGTFEPVRSRRLRYTMALPHGDVCDLVLMGPNAWHTTAEAVRERLRGAPEPLAASVDVELMVLRPACEPR